MSVLTSSKSVSFLFQDDTDYGKIKRLTQTLSTLSIDITTQQTSSFYRELFELHEEEPSKIMIVACRNPYLGHLKELISFKSENVDVLVVSFDQLETDVFAEMSCFCINASELPDDLVCQWLHRKIHFFKIYAETSAELYSRALHWSENAYEENLLLEQTELFGAISWLENSVESQKEFRNLTLKKDFIAASRQKHYPLADAYLHCGTNFQLIGNPILHDLRELGLEVIADDFISPKVFEQKFNEQEIKRSKNFIFVYSSVSTHNNECRRILSFARSLNKRIITLVAPKMKDYQLPPEIDQDNLVYIPDDWMYHKDFVKVIEDKIKNDYNYVTKHTQYLIDSFAWIKNKKSARFLIKENDLVQQAIEWQNEGMQSKSAPLISPLQKLYIEKSISAFSLQKNLKLGMVILIALLLVLGSFFLFFIYNGKKANAEVYNRNIQGTDISLSANHILKDKWQQLKADEADLEEFFKVFYGPERLTKQIFTTQHNIKSITQHNQKEELLLAYGNNYFDLIDWEGNKLIQFSKNGSQIYKAAFVPEKEKIISVGKTVCLWNNEGTLEKEINPGKNKVCQDFIFLPHSEVIAFLMDNQLILTDYELNELETVNTSSQLNENDRASLLSLFSDSGVALTNEKFLKIYAPEGEISLNKEELPAIPSKITQLNGKVYLLGKNRQLYIKNAEKWKNAELPLQITDYVHNDNSGLFLLDEKSGVYYFGENGELALVFADNSASSYISLTKTKDLLFCVTTNRFGGQEILSMPSSLPVYFKKKIALPKNSKKIHRTKKGFFLIGKGEVCFMESESSKIVLKEQITSPITTSTFNTTTQQLLIGTTNGEVKCFEESKGLIWEKKVFEEAVTAVISEQENILCGSENGTLVNLNKSQGLNFKHQRHQGSIQFLTLSKDGDYILSAGQDHQMIIWEKSGKQYNQLKGPSSLVKFAEFSSSASYLVSLGKAGDYILWDIEGNVIRHDYVAPEVRKIFFSSNGKFLMVCGTQYVKAINARGESLFKINLPENILLKDITETTEGLLEVLCENKNTNQDFIAYLPFSQSVMDELVIKNELASL